LGAAASTSHVNIIYMPVHMLTVMINLLTIYVTGFHRNDCLFSNYVAQSSR
jgi:hypothetical protein